MRIVISPARFPMASAALRIRFITTWRNCVSSPSMGGTPSPGWYCRMQFLGMEAASSSTIQPKGRRSHSGLNSARKTAIPMETGMAITSAAKEVIRVP